MTLRGREIEVKKLDKKRREKRKKEEKNEKERERGKRRRERKEKGEEERENFPLDHRRRNPALPPIPWLRLII